MKQTGFYIGLLMLVLASCTKSREKQLAQQWNVYRAEFIKTDSTKIGSDPVTAGFESAMQEVMGNMLTNTIYDLHADGTARITYNAKTTMGSWQMENSGKELLIVNHAAMGKEEQKEYKPKPSVIEHLDDTSMVLLMKSDQSTYNIRLRLHAIKPN